MRDLLQKLCGELESGRPVALATIMTQQGSAPRGAGSRLLAGAEGLVYGTVGGGLMEAKVIAACAKACVTLESVVLDFRLDGQLAAASDMICGGNMRVLVEPFSPNQPRGVQAAFSPARGTALALLALEAVVRGARIARPLPPRETAWSVLYDDGSSSGEPLPQDIEEILRTAPLTEPVIIHAGDADYFCEPCVSPERMLIIGGGHVSQPTAALGALTGFETHVIDDRSEFACRERFPESMLHIVCDYGNCLSAFEVTPRDYVIIVTRGHLYDREALSQALRTNAGYIGMIGSRRKRDQIYNALLGEGFTKAQLSRVHSPIGIGIGAETPEEIAVSIVAECIANRRGCLSA